MFRRRFRAKINQISSFYMFPRFHRFEQIAAALLREAYNRRVHGRGGRIFKHGANLFCFSLILRPFSFSWKSLYFFHHTDKIFFLVLFHDHDNDFYHIHVLDLSNYHVNDATFASKSSRSSGTSMMV